MNYSSAAHQAKLSKWAKLIEEHKASGMKVDDWCEANNLTRNAYYYWYRLIKESYLESITPDIVPLQMPMVTQANTMSEPIVPSTTRCTNTTPSLTISVNGISIEVTDDTSDVLLTKVIKAVRNA